jgi:transglutaminase-like putative cysteine protease
MRLSVSHETRFEYDQAPSYSVQRLCLTPPSFASQRVLTWTITAPGMDKAVAYVDGFGNRVHLVTFQGLAAPFTVSASGVVDCTDTAGVIRGLASPAPDAVYLRQTAATAPNPDMREMARAAARPAVLETLHVLMDAIHGHVTYEIGATHAHTTAAEAFAEGNGVCQDHSHMFLGMARSLGIPSRYVTGYLVTAAGEAATAAHAWAEALVPDLGWVGFDAANACCPTDHYVRVAAGIDATGITPIRGSRRGGAAERMQVEVRVEIDQQ